MYTINSESLNALLVQLNSGLITECEFLLALQIVPPAFTSLMEFNSLEIDNPFANAYSLDDFAMWRLNKHVNLDGNNGE